MKHKKAFHLYIACSAFIFNGPLDKVRIDMFSLQNFTKHFPYVREALLVTPHYFCPTQRENN